MELLEIRHKVSKNVWQRSFQIMKRVIQYNPGSFRLSGLVMSSEGDYFYNPWLAADGTFYCDCQGYEIAETICSHILALLRKAEWDGVEIEIYISGLLGKYKEDENSMTIYKTSLEAYNKLFEGLQGGRHVSAAFSEPEVGKSLLNATFAVDMCVLHKKSAVIIDTEGGFAPEWIGIISEKRGITVPVEFIDWKVRVNVQEKDKQQIHSPEFDYSKFKFKPNDEPTVYIYDARNIVQILPFFGRPQGFKVKSGVIEPFEIGGTKAIWESPIGIVCEKADVAYVANDSISSPLESYFTGGQINYRTRTKATQIWLGRAQELIDEYKCVFMNTIHATIDHTNQWADPTPVGGKAVMHNNKYIAFMSRYKGKKAAKEQKVDWHNLRKLEIYRHMTKGAWSDKAYCMTSEAGIVDFDPKGSLEEEEE